MDVENFLKTTSTNLTRRVLQKSTSEEAVKLSDEGIMQNEIQNAPNIVIKI